jgi:hypothetical protein
VRRRLGRAPLRLGARARLGLLLRAEQALLGDKTRLRQLRLEKRCARGASFGGDARLCKLCCSL